MFNHKKLPMQRIESGSAKSLIELHLQPYNAKKVLSEADRYAISHQLFELRKYPSTQFRKKLTESSPKVPGKLGDDLAGKAGFVENMADLYQKTTEFLTKYGHLYLSGDEYDLGEFYKARHMTFNSYYSDMKPYMSSKFRRWGRTVFSSAYKVLFALIVPDVIQVITSAIEPLKGRFDAMDKKDFKNKSDMVKEFLFEDQLTSQEQKADDRLLRLKKIAGSAAELHETFLRQFGFLTKVITTAAANNRLLKGSGFRRYYSLHDDKIRENVEKILERLPPSAAITVKEANQHDIDWDNPECYPLRNKNFGVRFREETDLDGGNPRDILCLVTRFPKGSLRLALRSRMNGGSIGTHSQMYTSEIDILLPKENGGGLLQKYRKDIEMLFFVMDIDADATKSYTRKDLEGVFLAHGFLPTIEYWRERTLYDINGVYQIYIDDKMKVKKEKDIQRDFNGTLHLQRMNGSKQPKIFREIEKLDGLVPSLSGPYEFAIEKRVEELQKL